MLCFAVLAMDSPEDRLVPFFEITVTAPRTARVRPDAPGSARWRWRWDLNPRKGCPFTRFRGVRPRPLGDSTAAEPTRPAGAAWRGRPMRPAAAPGRPGRPTGDGRRTRA